MEYANEIELNGKKYVLKESITEEIKIEDRFSIKDEMKLHKELKKMLNEASVPISESQAIKNDFSVMCPANVMMIIPKVDRAKLILRRYCEFEDLNNKINKIPEINYETTETATTKLSDEYMQFIFNFFRVANKIIDVSKVIITAKKDYPFTAENDDFKIILAPRVGCD